MSQVQNIEEHADQAAGFLKALASPHRLLILCQLVNGEKNVTDLIEATGLPQTSMSQHLGKLRSEGVVTYRRDHRTLYYRIDHPAVAQIMAVMYDEFCRNAKEKENNTC